MAGPANARYRRRPRRWPSNTWRAAVTVRSEREVVFEHARRKNARERSRTKSEWEGLRKTILVAPRAEMTTRYQAAFAVRRSSSGFFTSCGAPPCGVG